MTAASPTMPRERDRCLEVPKTLKTIVIELPSTTFPLLLPSARPLERIKEKCLQSSRSTFLNIISGPALTYLFNNFIKNRSGRLRPDASNRESFPSSHTAIAAAFSENASIHTGSFAGKYATPINLFNESLVGVVGWARMESKKHHLSDVLVGYSVGKFFTKLFHYWLVEKKSTAKVGFSFNPGQSAQGTYTWEF